MAIVERERTCTQPGCGGAAVEGPWEAAFAEAWPVVEQRLRHVLRARKVPADDHEDFIQEVAARAIASQVSFHCAGDLLPWASTVLRRLHCEHLQRAERALNAQRRTSPKTTPDIAAAVVARLDLAQVADTVASWSSFDRDALLAPGTNASGAVYVRRHRLRAKLLAMIDGLAAAFPALRRLQLTHGHEAQQVAGALLSPVAIACAALVLPFGGVAGDDGGTASGYDHRAAAPIVATSAGDRTGPALSAPPRANVGVAQPGATAAARASSDGQPTLGRREPMRGPVEERVEVDAAGHGPFIELENHRERRPLFCFQRLGVVDDACADNPLPPLDPPVDEPW